MEEKTKEEKIFQVTDRAMRTLDGFQNFAAKLGISGQGNCGQNVISDGQYTFNLVTRNHVLLEAAYRGSWIVGRVIDCRAEDMTKAGIEITTNDGAEKVDEFEVQMSRLQIWSSLRDLIAWGDLYGGACAVLQIKGQDLSDPLDLEAVEKGDFEGLVVYDRWQLNPTLDDLITSGPNMGDPAFYDIVLGANINDPSAGPGDQQAHTSTGRVRVHHTRCIRNIGIKLPFWQAITEQMWGESVLERLWDRLIEFDTATASAGSLITRAQLRTVSIDGLRTILSAGGEAQAALVEMFEYMRKFQSSEGLTLLDKEDVFASTAYSFAGLSDMMIQFGQQVSGAAEIPLVRLFGQSPAGLNATGESDLRTYYDAINAKQSVKLRNPMETIIKVLWRSMYGEDVPKDFSFKFTPLWQISALDKSTIAKNTTDTIVEAHQEGLVSTATAMKELKDAAKETGLFSHIQDEDIEDAENEEPPTPEEQPAEPGNDPGQPGSGPAEPESQIKKATGDSWNRLKNLFKKTDRKPLIPARVSDHKKERVLTADQKKIREFIGR